MTRIWKLLLSGLLACSATAQAQTPSAPTQARRPQIWLDPALGKLDAIQLYDVSIDVRIEGFVASTTLDLTFFNPNARVLEGELVFPLATDQSVTGYALEVGGKLRQGVVVEKETARVAFEATERRGIDPGLAELTRGNVFRTRVYPIPANGTKRVALSFDQPLVDAGSEYRYVLPLQFAQKIRHFKVHAEAVRAEHKPKPATASSPLTFERWRDSFLADLDRTDFQPDRELAFAVDKPATPVTAFSVQDTLEPEWRTFAAQVQTSPPADAASAKPIQRIALFYDASGSARERNRERELEFLASWLMKLRNVDVDLVAFRNDADSAEHYHVRDGNSSSLRKAIEALPLDGGTSYGAIRLDPTAEPDVAIVFGDGLSNFADRDPQLSFADGSSPRVVFVHAAQLADTANLGRWVRRYGGQVINLLEANNEEALKELGALPWMLQTAHVIKGDCLDLAPAGPTTVGNTASIYGRCKGTAEIDLQFGNSAGASVHRVLKIDETTSVDADRGTFVGRLWAVARIADLQNAANPDDKAITELGKRFGVVTSNTSMLVLDRVEDYVRYRVEPREPELLSQYRGLLAAQPKETSEDQKKQRLLAQVLGWWTEFKQWHDERYPWLETVLVPTAEAEIARWRGVSAKESAARTSSAEKLAKRAKALQERWLHDGAAPATRTTWEHEATALMLELDALRQQRLALAPNSDQIKPETPRIAADTSYRSATSQVQHKAVRTMAPTPNMTEERTTATTPPPPAREVPTPALESVVVTGSNVRRVDIETANPVVELQMTAAGKSAQPGPQTRAHIELQEWDPNTPYLAILRGARDPYAAYLNAREKFASSPSFFLDSADYFRHEVNNPRLALRILSNLAEINLASAPLLRVLAYRLEQWDRFDLAVPLFEDALKLRGEEPQSYRDLGLALTRQPNPDYARATMLLWKVVGNEWDARFPEIQTIALHELNDVLARAPESDHAKLIALLDDQSIDHRLLDAVPADLRVVLTWDADDTDIDLWIIDPTGEVAIYNQPRTKTGGRISRDFTQGYGPEVFTIRRAIPGTYTVKANYFGNRQQKMTGDVTVQVEFFTQFDSGQNKREAVTRRLENKKDLIEVGRFVVGAK
jgi:Ca-activated chloride channel family protein